MGEVGSSNLLGSSIAKVPQPQWIAGSRIVGANFKKTACQTERTREKETADAG